MKLSYNLCKQQVERFKVLQVFMIRTIAAFNGKEPVFEGKLKKAVIPY